MSSILLLIVVLAVGNIEASETCAKKLDLAFAVDGSSSVCDGSYEPCPKWKAALQFCKDIVNSLTIEPDNTRVAFVKFSSFTEVEWDLRAYKDKTSLLSAIDNVKYLGGEMIDVVTISRYIIGVFDPLTGDRGGVDNILIVITDGAANFPAEAYALASSAIQLRGVTVFVVCITPGCTEHCAHGIASYPQKVNETYFLIDNYLSIDQVRDPLVKNFCAYKMPAVKSLLNVVK